MTREMQPDIDKLIEESKLDSAKLRQQMTFFRSIYVCGDGQRGFDQMDNAIDEAIERCRNELAGENLCLMSVMQVIVTPVTLNEYSDPDARRHQYIVTVLAKPLRGYPQETPQSRTTGFRNRHWQDEDTKEPRP